VVNVTPATTIIATVVTICIIIITIVIRKRSSSSWGGGPQRPRIKSPAIAVFALFFSLSFAVPVVHSWRWQRGRPPRPLSLPAFGGSASGVGGSTKRRLRTPALLGARRSHRADMTKTVDGRERSTLSQSRLARKEPFDIPPVLLVAIFDELRRHVLLSLTRLACHLADFVVVVLRLIFWSGGCRLLMATTTTPGLSLLVKQLRSTFPLEVEWGLFELFDDGQRSL
jgi:hypothetical protein